MFKFMSMKQGVSWINIDWIWFITAAKEQMIFQLGNKFVQHGMMSYKSCCSMPITFFLLTGSIKSVCMSFLAALLLYISQAMVYMFTESIYIKRTQESDASQLSFQKHECISHSWKISREISDSKPYPSNYKKKKKSVEIISNYQNILYIGLLVLHGEWGHWKRRLQEYWW